MEAELKANLIRIGAVYAGASGLARSTIGLRVARDARFFDRLDEGKGFTVKTYDSVMAWFSANWLDTVAWPSDIERPAAPEPASEVA